MAKRNLYAINAGIVKKGGASADGHYRSLDKIIWDILKCCGIDCCVGNGGNGGNGGNAFISAVIDEVNNAIVFTQSDNSTVSVGPLDNQTLALMGNQLTIVGGNTITVGATDTEANAGTMQYRFISPYQLSSYLHRNYAKYTEIVATTTTNYAITLTPAYRADFQNWFQVSINGVLLHEGTGANTYTIVNSTQITIDSVTTGDFIEVKYMA